MGRLAVEVLAKEAKTLVKPVEKEPELWFQAISTTGWLGPVPAPGLRSCAGSRLV